MMSVYRLSTHKLALLVLLIVFESCNSTEPGPDPVTTFMCETACFSEFKTTTNIVYGINSSSHTMTLFEPKDDARTERPVMILLSGGGFKFTNIGALEPLAIQLVKYGFVVVTANYRTGDWTPGTEYITRLTHATQDSKALVRYLRKEAANLNIGADHIYLGGYSAGGITSMVHEYVTIDEADPDIIDLVNSLGGLEGDQGNAGFSSDIRAVCILAGGMPSADEAIDAVEAPLFAAHGSNDQEIPCGEFLDSSGSEWFGGCAIVEIMQNLGMEAEIHSISGGNHWSPVGDPSQYISDLISFLKSTE